MARLSVGAKMFTLDACVVQMMFSYHDLMYCYNQKLYRTISIIPYRPQVVVIRKWRWPCAM